MAEEIFIPEAAAPATGNAASSPPPAGSMPDSTTMQLQSDLQELKKQFSEFTRQNLPEIDRVRQELASTAAERDNTASELQKLRRENAIKNLAETYGFTEVEFLDFVLQKNQIDTDNAEAAANFMQQFKIAHPRYFALPVKSGAGSRPGSAQHSGTANAAGSRMDALENMLNNAREIY